MEGAVARTVKAHEYRDKRGQILDAAQQLIYAKGYEQLTIQDLLDALKISKGAFYHYFDSKQALLEALIERLGDEGERLFASILADKEQSTLVRLQHFFDAAGRWKTTQKEYLLGLLQGWYSDDNALPRLHVKEMMTARIGPLLGALIAQGAQEGVLRTPYPDQTAEVVLGLLATMGDAFALLLLADTPRLEALARAERLTAAYNDALERVLGAPSGSLHLLDAPTLHAWFDATGAIAVTPLVREA
jgi:AcrR family transcriptional regulator